MLTLKHTFTHRTTRNALPQTSRLLVALFLALSSRSAEAQLYLDAQYGGTTPLAGFLSAECGAAFNGVASPGSCPGGQQGNGSSTRFTAANLCPNPDPVGCRFSQVAAPPSANNGWTPSDKVLQVRTGNGDNDPPAKPWGSGPRNELALTIDSKAVLAVSSNQQDLGHYTEGDDRWFGWATYIPTAPLFHDPPSCTNGDEGTTFFQIHEVGQCVGGGPLLMVALRRTDLANACHSPFQAGPDWMPALIWKNVWSARAPTDNCFRGLPNASPINGAHLPECNIQRLWPKAGANPSFARNTWHTFQLHVKFSANPSIGVLELWVDGSKVYPDPTAGDPVHQTTMFNWTNPPQCSTDPAATGPMPVYAKQGMYGLPSSSDLIYQADFKIGGTRQDVDPTISTSFSVAAAPSQVSTVQGSSSQVNVTVSPINGFAGTVGLSVSGLPSGASVTFNPSSAVGASYPITITGTSGALHSSTTISWTISAPSSNGPLWVTQVGSPADDYGYGAASDASGNVYLTGYSTGLFTSHGGGGRDAIAAKYSAAGALLWAGQLADAGDSFGRAIALDPNGNVYAVGSTTDSLGGTYRGGLDDAFLARWSAGTSGAAAFSVNIGTSGDDIAYGVATDAQGYVYVTGTTSGTFPGAVNAGGYDAFLAKFDGNANLLWVHQFGTSGNDAGYAVAVTPAGSPVVTGQTSGALAGSNAGQNDLFVGLFDPASGNPVWLKQRGTTGDEAAYAVAVDPNGWFVYVAGGTTGSLGFNFSNAGGSDAFLLQYTVSGGNVGFSRQIGTSGTDIAYGVSVDANENVYMAGTSNGSLGGPSSGLFDVFTAKYDLNGNQLWVRQLGSSGDEVARAVVASGSVLYVVGGTTGALRTPLGGKDVFVAKYAQ